MCAFRISPERGSWMFGPLAFAVGDREAEVADAIVADARLHWRLGQLVKAVRHDDGRRGSGHAGRAASAAATTRLRGAASSAAVALSERQRRADVHVVGERRDVI